MDVELGSVALQDPPPPVQADVGSVKTEVAELVLTVRVPLHFVPKLALPQVYESAPDTMVGPPVGENSPPAFAVMLPPPLDVVRAR